jgi:hypothetical protein
MREETQLNVADELKHNFAEISGEISRISWKLEAFGPRPVVVAAA